MIQPKRRRVHSGFKHFITGCQCYIILLNTAESLNNKPSSLNSAQ